MNKCIKGFLPYIHSNEFRVQKDKHYMDLHIIDNLISVVSVTGVTRDNINNDNMNIINETFKILGIKYIHTPDTELAELLTDAELLWSGVISGFECEDILSNKDKLNISSNKDDLK